MIFSDIIVSLLLLSGSIIIMLGSLGVLRFRDPLCRSHALGKASSFGISLMLAGLWVALDDEGAGLKVMLVIVLCLLTIPLASHFVALYVFSLQEVAEGREMPEDTKSDGVES